MRKLFIEGILLMAIAIHSYAQQIVMRDGPDKGQVKTLTEHLDFCGINITGDLANFKQQLRNKGFTVTGSSYKSGDRSAGSYGDYMFDGLTINTYSQSQKVYGLILVSHMASYSGARNVYYGLNDYIRKNYTNILPVQYNDSDNDTDEYVYEVRGLGTIKLSHILERQTIRLEFLDKWNLEKMAGRSLDRKWCDISQMIPSYRETYIGFTDSEILFVVKTGTKVYSFCSRGDDMDGIYYVLNQSDNYNVKKEIMHRYVKEAVSKQQQYKDLMTWVYRDKLRPICQQMADERQRQLQAQRARQSSSRNTVRNTFLDMIIDQVFPKSEQKYFEGLIGREGMRAITGASMGAVVGKPGTYEYNGMRFNNEAEMEDYKNANGYK